jgi:hypothetical protein
MNSRNGTPWLLPVIIQLAEFFRIHSQLAFHLNFGMGQTVALSRIDPCLHVIQFSRFHDAFARRLRLSS